MDLIEFIEEEIRKRDMSISAFARHIDVAPATLIDILNRKSNPGLTFVQKLSIGTNTDINIIIALIFPERTAIKPEAALLAERIIKLSPNDRRTVEGLVLGLALKRLQEAGDTEKVDGGETIEDE